MYKIKLFSIVLGLFLSSHIFAQILPSYPERSITDSSYIQTFATQVSEGAIEPDYYIVGPGDKIFVSISGIEESVYNLMINQEGYLYIPKVGGVDLRNKTLAEAKSIILTRLQKSYKNVEYFISLSDFRKIRISLIGDVKKPSTYVVTSNSRLIDLLKISYGLTSTSDFRNIKINSKDGSKNNYDYLSFLRLGDFSQNPFLKDGDVIIIDRINKMITINGLVKYPAHYEFKENETLASLINLAGGLLFNARKDSIELIRFAEDGKTQFSKYYSYDFIQNNIIPLTNGDQVLVRELPEFFIPQFVTVNGKVRYPGFYKIIKDKTKLTEIIKEAGGFLEDASLVDAAFNRTDVVNDVDPEFERIKIIPRADMTDDEYDYLKSKSRQRTGKVVVDFENLFLKNISSEDIILKRGDEIIVPEKKNYITLIGQVVNPGKIIYQPGLVVDDYIKIAGGFSWRAVEGDVRVIKVNTGEWVDADDIESLDPGDTIWVLEDPPGPKFWDVFITSLSVLGQVAAVIAATVAVIIATR